MFRFLANISDQPTSRNGEKPMIYFKECADCRTYNVCSFHERCREVATGLPTSEPTGPAGSLAVAPGSLSEAIALENSSWENLKVIDRQNGAKIAKLHAEIEDQRKTWTRYYAEVKRHRAANTKLSGDGAQPRRSL